MRWIKIDEVDKVGMKEYSSKMPHQISGEQQRVAIARALLNDPELILPMSQQEI
jgi:cell division transport system ATP-binding protein